MAQNIKAEKSGSGKGQKQASPEPRGKRGGARPGAGRKSGSGAFGEGTVPMRIPASMAPAVDSALEEFKRRVAEAKQAGSELRALDLPSLSGKALSLASVAPGAPSGKPVDIARAVAKRPESCFAWTAPADQPDLGLLAGDMVVVDRSGKAAAGSVVAVWGERGIELSARSKGAKQTEPWGVAVAVVRKLAD